ncbi:hypothetical protein QA089_001070 [Meyerozyma guilliermondii]
MAKQVFFIAGASRGIGLSLATLLSKNPENVVIATARNPASASGLQELSKADNVHVVTLDLNNEKTYETAKADVLKISDSIDVFIVNAGISNAHAKVLDTTKEEFLSHFTTNTLGPFFLLQTFLGLEQKGAAGSVSVEPSYVSSAYGISKAALNYGARQIARDLSEENFIVVPVHPGLVGTDLLFNATEPFLKSNPHFKDFLGPENYLTPDQSAKGLVALIEKLKKEDSGKFWNYDGTEVPW